MNKVRVVIKDNQIIFPSDRDMLEQLEEENERDTEEFVTESPSPTDPPPVTRPNGKPIKTPKPKKNTTKKQIRINRPAFKRCLSGGNLIDF